MPQIQTPQEQLEQVLNQPGVTPKQIQQAEDWARNESARRKGFGMHFVAESTDRIKDKSTYLDEELYAQTQAANALHGRVQKHDLDNVAEGFKTAREIKHQVDVLERAIEAIESTEQTIAAVRADPAGYFHEFYSRYPALADRVPTIAEAFYD